MKSDPILLVAVCDDNTEILAQTGALVEQGLASIPHKVETFSAPQDLLLAASYKNYGLAVLDIMLKDENGIRVAGDLQARCPGCRVIFLTAYLNYAQDVYDVEHIGFILKEEMQTRLPVALERFCRTAEHEDEKTVSINEYGTLRLLRQNKIRFLERHLRTTDIHCVESDVTTTEKLEDILSRLDGAQFCQCHKSYIVNWAYVESFAGDGLNLKDGTKVPVSRRNIHRVREALFRYAMCEEGEPG